MQATYMEEVISAHKMLLGNTNGEKWRWDNTHSRFLKLKYKVKKK
jgi:hypothetical protein